MSDILNLLKNAVNMNSYGASKNFVGYFEKDGKYKRGLAEDAVQFFFTFFGASSDHFILASSLHANSDEIGHSGDEVEDKKDLALIEDLTGSGVLKSFSYDKQFGFDYQTDGYETAVEAAWCDIQCRPMTDYEPSDLKKLLLAKMLVYGLHGHCFLISDRLGLVFYPHDDIGFGVVALSNSADIKVAQVFLQQAGQLKNFNSIIEWKP